MTNIIINEVLSGLNKELEAIVGKEYEMTQANYYALMSIKNRTRDLTDSECENVTLNPTDSRIRLEMQIRAYEHLNKMEKYYEDHGGEWAEANT